MHVREQTEDRERSGLSTFASLAKDSHGREIDEEQDPVRTCFQRDRDRILHSKSFRRLMHKTQVFIAPAGDHYRTRLTHTLEVSQISRTIARALSLNEDLAEAIALGHDVGHTPFGHAGEAALDDALRARDPAQRFRHYEQSLRVLAVLERLNLTHETLEGIGGHSKGRSDLVAYDGENCPSLEGAVVRVADRIAYLNHDLDDALRAGWLRIEDLPSEIVEIGETHGTRIGQMVIDLIENSAGKPMVGFGARMLELTNFMKEYLFESFYLDYPSRLPHVVEAQGLVHALFDHYANRPKLLPNGYSGLQGVVDYVSGMTDRYAARLHGELFPAAAPLSIAYV
ncbi:MAG: deoxyguanosinetriphosphate triphosphohydrolase [Armatimonadetes bacterium]|nr:deoxyguanosinetriphosphate triphosphohydrolase [Armatimonadota bacterium]